MRVPSPARANEDEIYSLLFQNDTQSPIAFRPSDWSIVWAGVDVLTAGLPVDPNVSVTPREIDSGRSIEMTYTIRLDSGRWKVRPSFSGGHDDLGEAEVIVEAR